LDQAARGQTPLLSGVLTACYLSLSERTAAGIDDHAGRIGAQGFEVATAVAMQAIAFCNEQDANLDAMEYRLHASLREIESRTT
jgi:hypothetical protein